MKRMGNPPLRKPARTPQQQRTPAPLLPMETLLAILDELSIDNPSELQRELGKLRLVSKTFEAVATERLFKSLTVHTSDSRREALRNVADSSWLRVHVKEIVFMKRNLRRLKSPERTVSAFLFGLQHLSKFPNVNGLQIVFPTNGYHEYLPHYEDKEDTPDEQIPFSRLLQRKFFRLLEQHSNLVPNTLRTLKIEGLIATSGIRPGSNGLKFLWEPLTNLEIHVLTNSGEWFTYDQPFYRDFWDIDMTTILNTARNLTTLSLNTDIPSYHDWTTIHAFPNLTNLTLTNILFAHDTEQFILSHREILQHLDLSECRVNLSDEDLPMGSWANKFKHFEQQLQKLRSIRFYKVPFTLEVEEHIGYCEGYVWCNFEAEETLFEDCFVPDDAPPVGTERTDRVAFDSLQRSIAQRIGK